MTMVVASTSTNSGTNASSITVTAPTGITTGDLLFIFAQGYDGTATPAGFTESFSETYTGSVARGQSTVSLYYKYAALADETEADYTVTFGSSDGGGHVAMMRVTGWTSGDPILASNIQQANIASSTGTATRSVSVDFIRPGDSLQIMFHSVSTDDSSISFDTSNYTLTTTEGNPTWTEMNDSIVVVNSDVNSASSSFALAYTTNSDTSDITGYSFDIDEGSSNSMGTVFGLLNIVTTTNASGSNSLLTPNVTVNDANAVSGAAGTNALFSISPTFTAPVSTVDADEWTNETRPTFNQSLLNAVGMDGNNRVYMDGSNKIYRSASTRDWSNETRP